MLAIATALTRSWTAFYTRGLPPDLRSRRREEIDCDLWEHERLAELEREPGNGTAVAILLRLTMGAPADILWRLEAGASARSGKGTQMNDSKRMRGLFILALFVAIVPAGFGVAVLLGNGDLDSSARVMFGTLWIVAAATMVLGLVLSGTRPGLGVGLVAGGALLISVMMFWIFFVTVPLGAGLVYLAYRRARRTGWRLRGDNVPNATA